MGDPHIRTVNLEKTYRLGEIEVRALRGVSLEFERGDYVALCGASGSGKTTLLNLLGCLDQPSQGSVSIGGANVSSLDDNALADFRARKLGFIFQTFNLLPVLNAYENVEYPLLKLGLRTSERKSWVMEYLERVGLASHHAHRPNQLSGGQRQRVAIARALVHRPEIVVADELTASLDKNTAAEILKMLRELNSNLKVTVILATHDQSVMDQARRRVQIADGSVLL